MFDDRYAAQAHSLLRIIAGLLFLAHGMSKLFGFPPFMMGPAPIIGSLFWIAGVIELVAGVLIVIGLYSRPAALIASGEMAIGYFMIHAAKSPFPSNNMGDAAVLFCFVFLFIAAAGPGPWSVDAGRVPKD